MNLIAQWFRSPQKIWLRRAIFQIHLWMGVGLGLYVFLISVTGAAIVPRRELTARWVPQTVQVLGKRMSYDELKASVLNAYPGYELTYFPPSEILSMLARRRPNRPIQVALKSPQNVKDRLFDPYTGKDLGDVEPRNFRVLMWVVRLHDDLLMGDKGRQANGVLGILITIVALTGAMLWWPGQLRWWRSLIFRPSSNFKSLVWQLHSMVGFWSFLILLLWTVTGIYFTFPRPFQAIIYHFYPIGSELEDQGTVIEGWLVNLHFGRFGGLGIRTAWVIMGLLPAALFVTGAIMWWNRVLRPKYVELAQVQESDGLAAVERVGS